MLTLCSGESLRGKVCVNFNECMLLTARAWRSAAIEVAWRRLGFRQWQEGRKWLGLVILILLLCKRTFISWLPVAGLFVHSHNSNWKSSNYCLHVLQHIVNLASFMLLDEISIHFLIFFISCTSVYCYSVLKIVTVLMQLVGWEEGHPACIKSWLFPKVHFLGCSPP